MSDVDLLRFRKRLICAWQILVWGLRTPAGFDRFDRTYFQQKLRELGRMSFAECTMLGLFIVTALLWLLRTDFTFGDWVIVRGWGGSVAQWLVSLGVPEKESVSYVSDATVAMAVASLMFILPVGRTIKGQTEYLMNWETTTRIPWGILLLFGGGFAIAGAFESTKLSHWVGEVFKSVADLSRLRQPDVLVTAVCILLTFLTEFTSNVATVNTVLPIIAAASNT